MESCSFPSFWIFTKIMPKSYFLTPSVMQRRCSFHLNITLPNATNTTLGLQLEGGNHLLPLGSLLSETSFCWGKPASILTRVWNHHGWQVANVVLFLKLNFQSQKAATLRKGMLCHSVRRGDLIYQFLFDELGKSHSHDLLALMGAYEVIWLIHLTKDEP